MPYALLCKLIVTLLTYSKSCFQHPGGILTHLVLSTEIIYYNANYDIVSFIKKIVSILITQKEGQGNFLTSPLKYLWLSSFSHRST